MVGLSLLRGVLLSPPPHRTESRKVPAGIAPNVGNFVLPRPTDNRPKPDLFAPSAPPPPFHPSPTSMVSTGNSVASITERLLRLNLERECRSP